MRAIILRRSRRINFSPSGLGAAYLAPTPTRPYLIKRSPIPLLHLSKYRLPFFPQNLFLLSINSRSREMTIGIWGYDRIEARIKSADGNGRNVNAAREQGRGVFPPRLSLAGSPLPINSTGLIGIVIIGNVYGSNKTAP